MSRAGEGAIIGIDPGRLLGWAIIKPEGGMVAAGTLETRDGKARFDPIDDCSVLMLHLDWISSYTNYNIDKVVVERGFARGDTDRQHNYLRSTVANWAIRHKAEYQEVSPTRLKKHATGSGKAEKSDMYEAAIERWPNGVLEEVDDNAIDAALLATYGLEAQG